MSQDNLLIEYSYDRYGKEYKEDEYFEKTIEDERPIVDDDREDNKIENRFYSREIKRNAEPGVHYPNKNEAKVLRRLKSQTGMSEKEIREHKSHRIMLSKAQKEKGEKDETIRRGLVLLKDVLRELKLPKEHPKVLEVLKNKLNDKYNEIYFGFYKCLVINKISPEQILKWSKDYKKKK